MDSYISWQYQIADHSYRITWVYNNNTKLPSCADIISHTSLGLHAVIQVFLLSGNKLEDLMETKADFIITRGISSQEGGFENYTCL